jgi:acetyltransferase-like isoleucine patch superfamily enzyme
MDILEVLQRGRILVLRKLGKATGANKLVTFGKAVIRLNKTSRLVMEPGTFSFNKPWIDSDPLPGLLAMGENATLQVDRSFTVYSGARIYLNNNSTLRLGSGYINHNVNISCFQRIDIGDGVVISENVSIRDSDNHEIVSSAQPPTQPIKIGNHVWIGMNVTILKGVEIGDGAIIAAGAVVTRSIPGNCLAGGVPARVLKENVAWK